jgi:hypothetical protein
MLQYRPEIRTLVEILSYMIKDADPEGMEIYFTNSGHYVKSRHTTKLLKSIDKEEFKGSGGIIPSLQRILARSRSDLSRHTRSSSPLINNKTPRRPLNVYVLSNGQWNDGDDVEASIRQFSHKITESYPRGSSHVGIQFIKFGADPAGQALFNRLDDGLYFHPSVHLPLLKSKLDHTDTSTTEISLTRHHLQGMFGKCYLAPLILNRI